MSELFMDKIIWGLIVAIIFNIFLEKKINYAKIALENFRTKFFKKIFKSSLIRSINGESKMDYRRSNNSIQTYIFLCLFMLIAIHANTLEKSYIDAVEYLEAQIENWNSHFETIEGIESKLTELSNDSNKREVSSERIDSVSINSELTDIEKEVNQTILSLNNFHEKTIKSLESFRLQWNFFSYAFLLFILYIDIYRGIVKSIQGYSDHKYNQIIRGINILASKPELIELLVLESKVKDTKTLFDFFNSARSIAKRHNKPELLDDLLLVLE